MKEAEKDPEERRKRRLVQEEFPDNPSNPFDRFKNVMSCKKGKMSISSMEGNPLGEGPSRFGTSVSLATPACIFRLSYPLRS